MTNTFNFSKQKINAVAKVIRFCGPDDKLIFRAINSVVDVVKSYTIICSNNGFVRYRILVDVENFDVDLNRVRVNYENGYYLLIKNG